MRQGRLGEARGGVRAHEGVLDGVLRVVGVAPQELLRRAPGLRFAAAQQLGSRPNISFRGPRTLEVTRG